MDGRLFTVAGVALGLSLLGLVNPYKDSAARWDQNDLGEFGSVSESPDQWRGSSLGMTITGWAPGRFEVETVRPGLAAATAGVYPGDQLIKVGDIDLLTQGRKQLTDYLKTLPPNTKIPVKVSRTIGPSLVEGSQENGGGRQRKKRLNLMLSTDSEAMLDGWLVAEHLQANPVIHHSLKLRGELKRLETLKTQILHGVKKSKSPRIAYERINRWIDQLGVSHAAILPAWGYARLTQRASGGIGLILKRLVFGGRLRYFVVDLQAGGPAGVSELKIGDEVVEVNGVPLDKSARLVLAGEEQRQQLFTVTSAAFESLTLTCRKTASGGLVRIQLKTDSKLSAV
jgi:C-terminal processing protease CtpA/Prc